MVKNCPRCGKKNYDDALWCVKCNYRLVKNIGLDQSIKQPQKSDPAVRSKGSMPLFVRQEKKSRKKIGLATIITALILIIPVSYLLYVEINRPSEEIEFNKFIGKWVSEEDNSTLVFYKNKTCVFKNTTGFFEIRDGSIRNNEPNQLLMEFTEKEINRSYVYTFEFNKAKNKLTLAKVIDIDETEEEEIYSKT